MLKKWSLVASAVVGMIALSFIIFVIFMLAGSYQLDEEKLMMNRSSVLVDTEGNVITNLYMENREFVSITEIPEYVQQGFVAMEDSRFYEHQGIDFRAIGRALYRDILAGAKVEGGSTITQQLAKNLFLSNEKAWLRKTNEVLIAMNLERRYSKEEILEMYLNQIYFGHGAYGIEAASQLYFNKPAKELTVYEGASLVAVVNAPSTFSPLNEADRNKERRDLVLTVMAQQGYLSSEEASSYQDAPVETDHQEYVLDEALFTYIDMVMDEASERYNMSNNELLTGGYRIVSPINLAFQHETYQALHDERFYPEGSKDAQGTMMFMDVNTGGVLAAQGGKDYVRRGLNRLNVNRSPASTFKPLAVYAPALESGMYHPYSTLKDELLLYEDETEDGYTPRNASGVYSGEMTLYDSLVQSANAPAVWLLNEMGLSDSVRQLKKFGLQVPDRQLSLALGGLYEGVTPYEMTKSYRSFAHEGQLIEPHFIKDIYDSNGKRVGGANLVETEVMSEQTAWSMTRMLEQVMKEGTGATDVQTTSPIAGKTGTQGYPNVDGAVRDAWFVGYTPEVVGSVWMGYDTTTDEQYFTGGSQHPTRLFQAMVNKLPASNQGTAFVKPEGVKDLEPPIAMEEITNFEASYSLGGNGFLSVQLEWEAFEDDRMEFNVYEVHDDERKRVATNLTEPRYSEGRYNPFSIPSYQIVAYDPVTEVEGSESEIVKPSFEFSFSLNP
ncbi:PBP1A family penicillin-binding protein [Bacillus sp. C1-1]|uniref:PBP1A family penicillin-binding protein n=2 Tax=Shouchella lehensis TaxID=300825 RepID=A0A4Y7WKB6_9BACI|nr:PBP1A family penicillin-binding protein [Bacillus sp. C1-1]TES48531.1 PBP1A family penicillin-binding protein [Shouchella lehensis]